MPLNRCTKNGTKGWKWGDSGTCYIGSNARRNALRQAQAIYASGFSEKNALPWTSEAWDTYYSQFYNEKDINTIRYINRELDKIENGEVDETN